MGANAWRRYPALAFLAVAAVLATLLPTALHVPLAGPSGQAEVAPVSGRGAANGDVSSLDAASSGGLGFGRGGGAGAGAGGADPVRQARQRHANTKRCVGKPARQTEDPLSPPCVPFFDGDNGGATAPGVTRDEAVVVVVTDADTSGQTPGFTDWQAAADPADTEWDRMGKAFLRYFNDRFQTYGRTVHAFRYHVQPGTPSADVLRADVGAIETAKHPFAVVPMLTNGAQVVAQEASRRAIMSASYDAFSRELYRSVAPYLLSFTPDLENQAEQAAAYVCTKLAHRPARYAGDATLAGQPRRFGIFYEQAAQAPSVEVLARLVHDALVQRCAVDATMAAASADSTQQAATTYTTAAASLSRDGVTTVIDVARGGTSATMSSRAAAAGYFPEWFIPGGGTNFSGPDRVTSGQTHNTSEWKAAFGISFDVRRDLVDRQAWHQAFAEGCAGCAELFHSQAPVLYDTLSLLFYGIQSSGPRLSPANVDKGLHAIPARRSVDPYTPAAYFAAGNWSFVKDAVEMWWDASGTPPGDNRPGCYRLVGDGLRSRAADWSGDDSALFSGQPACQGVAQRIRS